MSHYMMDLMLAAIIALIAVIISGPFFIPLLRRLKAGQVIRDDGPSRHLGKAGTPTMGGIMMILALIVANLAVGGQSREIAACLAVTTAFGLIGFTDDYIKVVLRRSLGLRAREKLIMQLFFSLLFGIYLVYGLSRGTAILIPVLGTTIDLGYFYLPFLVVVFMSAANGVNLTDGLDGLAAGTTLFVALGLASIGIMTDHPNTALFAASMAGACLGFLVYNHYPARVFMGDTGSMTLGAAVAAVACVTRTEVFLIILGGIYVIETLSVIIQVISYQTTGKRVFLMSPLHHHFELKGWKEKQVVYLFWALSIVFTLLGLWSFYGIR